MTSTSTRMVATNGVELRVIDAGGGPPVILAHGFPELAHSWRHQVPALAAAVTGGLDWCPPDAAEAWLADHRGTVLVDGAGHWVQQEAPDEVNAALLTFLAGL